MIAEQKLIWTYQVRRASPVTEWARPDVATEWHVKGEPPAYTTQNANPLPDDVYRHLIVGAPLLDDNLKQSWSGLCLATRSALGVNGAKRHLAQVAFKMREREFTLDQLLTIKPWSTATNRVSRVVLFDGRSERADRLVSNAATVVADGASTLLKVLAHPRFQNANVIGVLDRTSTPESLENVGARLQGLNQWFETDRAIGSALPTPPPGVTLFSLRRRPR